MIPENRLETLLTQAQDFQKSSCVYHNVQQSELSLFEDHHCDRFAPPHGTIFLHALPLFEEKSLFFFFQESNTSANIGNPGRTC